MNHLDRELTIVELDGSEKTWIGGIAYCLYRNETAVDFIRCIDKAATEGKETKVVTLKETNGSYELRYWTNLPGFWDNHAVVSDVPETVLKYEYFKDVFEDETVLNEWLEDDAFGYWDDGCERSHEEFEELCAESVERWKDEVTEIPYSEWLAMPPEEDDD